MHKIFFFFLLGLFVLNGFSQIVINEASNKNVSQFQDEDGDYNDWIEIYNKTDQTINLSDCYLSDSYKNLHKWQFGNMQIGPHEFMLINASGKDVHTESKTGAMETPVLPSNDFRYIVPTQSINNWNSPDFNDSNWSVAKAGFGYGDDDDVTIIEQGTAAVYLRTDFSIPDASKVLGATLHVDFDDGFVAYWNGTEIARSNVNENAGWNDFAMGNREARMYSGGSPEEFEISPDLVSQMKKNGTNVLSFEVHNVTATSSDMSFIPYFSLSLDGSQGWYDVLSGWFPYVPSDLIHTNFKLDNAGEKIYLSHGEEMIDSFHVTTMDFDQSVGRSPDGAEQIAYFNKATPGASNTTRAFVKGYTQKPLFDQQAGFYDGGFYLTMSTTDPGGLIRYTTDGSIPDSSSNRYTQRIHITETQVIRARVFAQDKLPGVVKTATYIVNDEFTLPVISVTANPQDIFGSEGIFTNWRGSRNIASYMEYFGKDEQLKFEQNAGMQMDGGAGGSRSRPQHSFRLEPQHPRFGDGTLEYPLLHRRPNRTEYPSFYVRNGSNQYLTLPYKDGLEVEAMGKNTHTYYSAYEPAAVFLNGDFFGIYELREKINDDFLEDNYDMDTDSLDFLGVSYFKGGGLHALRGTTEQFLKDVQYSRELDPKAEDYLDKMGTFLDIDSYTDYIIGESWIGNVDWPQNNIKLFRCVGTDMKWQWALNDLEWSLKPHAWSTASNDHIAYMQSRGENNQFVGFWIRMMRNEEYKANFINRFADLMNTNYHFDKIGPLEQEMFEELNAEMDREYQRWGNSNIQSQLSSFENNHQIFKGELEIRSSYVRQHLKNHFGLNQDVEVILEVEPEGAGIIKISTIAPEEYPWKGQYFTDVPIKIEALPNLGYSFDRWQNNSFIVNLASAIARNEFIDETIKFKAYFKETGKDYSKIVVNELNYKPSDEFGNADWVELINISNDLVDLKDWSFSDEDSTHRFIFDNNLVLNPGEMLVLTNDLDEFKIYHENAEVYPLEFDFGFSSDGDVFNLYNNYDQLQLSFSYADSIPWPLSYDDMGRTLELAYPVGNFNDPHSWFQGCIGGSPGKEYEPCSITVNDPADTKIVISEINYRYSAVYGGADWFEIYNQSTEIINLKGYRFSDGITDHLFTFEDDLVLAPEERLVLSNNIEEFLNYHAGVEVYPIAFNFGFDRSSDKFNMYNDEGQLIISFAYASTLTWPLYNDDAGRTLQLVFPVGDLNFSLSWQKGCIGGSPGLAFETCADEIPDPASTDIVVSEINYKESEKFGSADWIELYNYGEEEIDLNGWSFRNSALISFVFEESTLIQPGERLVITNNIEQFKLHHPEVSVYSKEFSFDFKTEGDAFMLYGPDEQAYVIFVYSSLDPWPLSNDDKGRTLELVDLEGNYSMPDAWKEGCIGGSPGTVFQDCTEDPDYVITFEKSTLDARVFPNPSGDFVYLGYTAPERNSNYKLEIFNATGQRVKSIAWSNTASGYQKHFVDLTEVPGGILSLKIFGNEGSKTLKLVKLNH